MSCESATYIQYHTVTLITNRQGCLKVWTMTTKQAPALPVIGGMARFSTVSSACLALFAVPHTNSSVSKFHNFHWVISPELDSAKASHAFSSWPSIRWPYSLAWSSLACSTWLMPKSHLKLKSCENSTVPGIYFHENKCSATTCNYMIRHLLIAGEWRWKKLQVQSDTWTFSSLRKHRHDIDIYSSDFSAWCKRSCFSAWARKFLGWLIRCRWMSLGVRG